MYSAVIWDIDPAAPNAGTVEATAIAALDNHRTCRITAGMHIVRVASGTDFVIVAEALQGVAEAYPGVFTYALWALPAGSAMRTNLAHDEDCRREVTNA